MSTIEANVIITVPDNVDVNRVIVELESIISELNGRRTNINIVQIDDPLSTNQRTTTT